MSCFSKFGPWNTALDSSGWWLEKQVPVLYLRFTGLKFLGGPGMSILTTEFHSSARLIFRALKCFLPRFFRCPLLVLNDSLSLFLHMSVLFVPCLGIVYLWTDYKFIYVPF